MGLSAEVTVILAITGIALFAIHFILMKYDKRFAGFALMLVGFSMFALPSKVPNISEYILGAILILVAIGFYVALMGFFTTTNKLVSNR